MISVTEVQVDILVEEEMQRFLPGDYLAKVGLKESPASWIEACFASLAVARRMTLQMCVRTCAQHTQKKRELSVRSALRF
jgi:hypothetical protein